MQRISDMLGKVIDSYQIQEVLGKGGMGVVYKAIDTSLDKVVALKVMNPLLVEDERFLGRFKSEAKALGRLHHPHIVSVFALRHVEQHFFIVMEYIEGVNLADRIKGHGPMDWQDALPIIEQTLQAIDYAHRQQIIHRDVKPHNILLSPGGVAKMTDFGLAKIQAVHSDTKALTRTGFTGGTLYYMPPEQLEGLLHVDHRGDIYGLGMTYYELLAGRTPFDKLSSEFAILKAIDAHDFPRLSAFNAAVPEPLVRIVMKAIEREPDDRYQSADEVLKEIEAWKAGPQPEASKAKQATTPTPGTPEAPGILASLKAALAKGKKKDTDSVAKTVIKKAPSKAKAPPKVKTPPKPKTPPNASSKAPPEPPPKAPSRQPVAAPPKSPADEKKEPEPEPSKPVPETPKPGSEEQQSPAAEQRREPEPLKEAPVEVKQKKESDSESPKLAPEAPKQKEDRKPEPPKPTPAAPSPQPSPEPEAKRPVWRRLVVVVGVFVVLAALLYVGSQSLSPSTAVPADSTATEQMILFSLRTLPDSAAIFIDGQRVGSTPLIDYEIVAGTTAFRIEKPGYFVLDTLLILDLDQDSTFTFSLLEDVEEVDDPPDEQEPEVGALTINSEPAGADVLLDGRNVGQTPLTVPDLETRAYGLVLRKQGFQDYSGSITVAPGNANQVTTTLEAVVAAPVQVTVKPFGDIYIDGMLKAQGSAETYTEEITAGVYLVRARHPEFGTWDKQVMIDSSDPKDIVFDFNQTFDVRVTSEPDGAEILVDGQPVNTRTPAVIPVRAGQRTISVRRRGYLMEGAARRFTLERDWTDEPLHFPLRAVQ